MIEVVLNIAYQSFLIVPYYEDVFSHPKCLNNIVTINWIYYDSMIL